MVEKYDSIVLGLGPDPTPTHRLDVYGLKDDREEALETWLPALRIRPLIVHHRRLTKRTVFTAIVQVATSPKGDFNWQHLCVIAALVFVLGVVLYNAAVGS